MRLALYQPDIPQNAGALLRLAACLGVPLEIVEPCGFGFTERQLRRVALDYAPAVALTRHVSWPAFEAWRRSDGGRLVLLTTAASDAHHAVAYRDGDILMVGRESGGVPEAVRRAADLAVRIPMRPGARALNVATAAAIVAGEALRQAGWPGAV